MSWQTSAHAQNVTSFSIKVLGFSNSSRARAQQAHILTISIIMYIQD
jgi:hypothetical protein